MSNWQDAASRAPLVYGFNLTGMVGTTMTVAGSTAFSPGTYVEMVPSLPFDVEQVEICSDLVVESEEFGAFWLAIGAAGSERAVMNNIPFSGSGFRGTFPLYLPRAARVSIGINLQNGANLPRMYLRVWPRRWSRPAPPTRWQGAYTGPVWSNDPTVVGGTEAYGAWTEMVAAAPFPVRFLGLLLNGVGAGGTRQQHAYRLGVGAIGSERLVWDAGPNASAFFGRSTASGYSIAPVPTIPVGSRLACQAASVSAAANVTVRPIFGG